MSFLFWCCSDPKDASLDCERLNDLQLGELRAADKQVDKFSLQGRTIEGKCVHVYDGDTIHIVIFLNLEDKFKFVVRLDGIDTAEIRTKDKKEKAHALAAKQFVEEACLGEIILLRCHGTEKYGRLLADVFVPRENLSKESKDSVAACAAAVKTNTHRNGAEYVHLNKLLINKGLAKVYHGGAKDPTGFE